MKIDRRIVIALFFIVLTVLTVASLLLVFGVIHYTENLRVEEFKKVGYDTYSAKLLDRYGVTVANVYVQISPSSSGVEHIPLKISIWHKEDAEIDSLKLMLSGRNSFIPIFLGAPTNTLQKFDFHLSSDGLGVILEVDDSDSYSGYSLDLNFLLAPTIEENLQLELNLSMHKVGGIPLTIQKAVVFGSFPIQSGKEIACPIDGSPYVWTPIGSRSENFNWRCLQCGNTWRKTYSEDVYRKWRVTFLDPAFVRDYTILYLREIEGEDLPDPLSLKWSGGRETPAGVIGSETYIYHAEGITVNIKYPVVLPENTIYDIRVEYQGRVLWEGKLYQRKFTATSAISNRPVYEYYGGVNLFKEGVYIIATESNPTSLLKTSNFSWETLKKHVTVEASSKDYISIIISRGEFPTGGYTIQLENFNRLDGYPTIFSFTANFTDPGKGVIVTQAFTNPMVLIPIGRLPSGEYTVEVHIKCFILTYDELGKPVLHAKKHV